MPQPDGRPTRGKTATNRLRRIDHFLIQYDRSLLTRKGGGLIVDLGYGRVPITTVEMAQRFWKINAGLWFLGVEIDRARIDAADAFRLPRMEYRLGGFDLPLSGSEQVRMIRAMNVLRQYPEAEAVPYHIKLCKFLMPGGLLIEGTSSPFGRRIVINLFRKIGFENYRLEALLFSTNFREGFTPDLFPPVLPKHLIHRNIPGEDIFLFFEEWKRAADRMSPFLSYGIRQHFMAAAESLALSYPTISTKRRWLRSGLLLWRWPPYP
ncbi:MAG: class I SAM-dependent methyltransferase [Myxococcota bacterium]